MSRPAFRIALIYILFGTVWILVTDRLVGGETTVPLDIAQTLKGMLFVVASGALIFLLIRRYIQQHTQTAALLRMTDESLRFLFTRHPQPMYIADLETMKFLDVNEAMCAKYGYTREEFLDMTMVDIRPTEDVEMFKRELGKIDQGFGDRGLWRHRAKDGRIFHVRIAVYRTEYEGRDAILVAISDATEIIQTQAELRETRELMQQAWELAEIGSWSVVHGEIETFQASREVYRICGIPETVASPGQAFFEAIHPDDRIRVLETIRVAVENQQSFDVEHRVVRPDGEIRWLHARASVIKRDADPAERIAGIVMDITERKRLQEEVLEKERLSLQLAKEAELRKTRAQFFSVVSHEFRNPLAVIGSAADILHKYGDRLDPQAREERFQIIVQQVAQLREMMDDVSILARGGTVGQEFNPEKLDIVALLMTLVEEARLAHGKTHTIHVSGDLTSAPVMGDPKLLRYALSNLIGNAAKYSPPGSNIEIEVRREPARIVISVKDQGIGIPQEDLENIFTVFYRADNAKDIPGTGLGLAIARQSADLHGGTLTVASELGKGSTFTLTLPLVAHNGTGSYSYETAAF